MTLASPRLGRFVLLGAFLLLSGCSMILRPVDVRGNKVSQDELNRIRPGTTTQADASTILGSPTAKGTFNQNDWYYISEMTRPVVAGTNSVLSQQVVVLNFNDQGVLQNVHYLNQQDALNVPIVGRTTPSPGTEAGFFQQLLGNIGKFTPGITQSQAPSGGVPVQ